MCRAESACPAAEKARLANAEVVLQALDGRATFERHLADGGQRCAATACSTGGIRSYPFSVAPSTRERADEAGERSLAETGAFLDLESSSWSSGRNGAGLDAGAWRLVVRKHPSSLLGGGTSGADHSRPKRSTAIVRRWRSSASTPAGALLEALVEEVDRAEPDHTSLSDANKEHVSSRSLSSASSAVSTASRARAVGCASGSGGGEGESEARGRGSGEALARVSGSGGRCERRFFLRGPATAGAVSEKRASRARRVDICSSSQNSQPPEENATAA